MSRRQADDEGVAPPGQRGDTATMDMKLSAPQRAIYTFIVDYSRDQGLPPTNREIGQAVGIKSTGHVDHHLSALEKKGLITRVRGKSRGIRINEERMGGLRVVGAIAAGVPLDHFADTEQETIDLGAHATGSAYVLLVKGHSMIEDHIADGDYVLIEPNPNPNDGDIVVATHMDSNSDGGAATLKRLYREPERDRVRLQPANAALDPIYISTNEWDREWEVQGKVIAVYRRC